jgi:hypothetical protein
LQVATFVINGNNDAELWKRRIHRAHRSTASTAGRYSRKHRTTLLPISGKWTAA